MFEPASEAFARMANIANYYQSIGKKNLAYKKAQRAVKKRVIEKSRKTGKSESSIDNEPSKANPVFKKYDKIGNIILRSPDGRKRIGTIV